MEEYVGKVCPFCKTEIKEGDAVKICPACKIPHHETCWEENKGCSTFGCQEQYYEARGTNPVKVCTNCGAALGEGQMFCTNCGQKADVAVDPALNATIAQFNAGVEKKKKKFIILPVVLAIVLIAAGLGGYFVYSNIQQKKKEEAIADYRKDAKEFCLEVATSGADMENIGNAIQSAWSSYIGSSRYGTTYNGTYINSVDSAVAAAQDEQSSAISDVRRNHGTIESLYKELRVIPDAEDQELQEIRDAVKDTYEAYQDMYDVIINVSGNFISFKSDFADTDTELADTIGDLSGLLN